MGDGSDESSAEEIGDMYHTTASRSERKPFTASVQVEGQDITMEIDTGSAVSIITERVYLEYFQHLQLQESSLQLRTYTGEEVKPEGVINVTVIYQEQAKVLPLYVLKSKGPCLFGRDWMAQIRLDWPLLHMKTRPRNLTEVLGQHAAVFSEGLGRLKNTPERGGPTSVLQGTHHGTRQKTCCGAGPGKSRGGGGTQENNPQ